MLKRIKDRLERSLSYVVAQLALDLVLVNFALWLGFMLRFVDERVSMQAITLHTGSLFLAMPIFSALYVVTFFLTGSHRVYWTYATVKDLLRVGVSVFGALAGEFLIGTLVQYRMPRLVYPIAGLLMLAFLFSFRLLLRYRGRKHSDIPVKKEEVKKVLLIGAGMCGSFLLREFQGNPTYASTKAVCIVDDDPQKIGKLMLDIPVEGPTDRIPELAEKYGVEMIFFAIAGCSTARRAELLSLCMKTGCEVRAIPPMSDLIDGKVGMRNLQNIRIEDLLGREPIRINTAQLKDSVCGKTVMVTGGGGSIGSELCRQIASFAPKQLIILDIYENNAYAIQNELLRAYPELDLAVRIASVRDAAKLDRLFAELRPQVVFHAAAHKHVPLMEDAPDEAVKNNIFGTLNTVQVSDRYGVERFVMISTDKAVNPTNIMGATKRVCEMIVQTYNRHSETDFVAVRFGNVLGSNGSVIPLFKSQIESGGPVTVTHPDIIRYFMTIPEAVSLVLQAGANAKGGEIFVLDMGKPVKIVDLAENLIRLSGHVPNVDIPIVFTGLRPGEKLFEELLMDEEGLQKTDNALIYIGHPICLEESVFFDRLGELREAAMSGKDVLPLMHTIVPTFKTPAEVNGNI